MSYTEVRILAAVGILGLCIVLGSCQSAPMPKWKGKIYAADHESESVKRAQANEEIKCSDEKFSEGVWMSYEDFIHSLHHLASSCEKWKKDVPVMGLKEAVKHEQGELLNGPGEPAR